MTKSGALTAASAKILTPSKLMASANNVQPIPVQIPTKIAANVVLGISTSLNGINVY